MARGPEALTSKAARALMVKMCEDFGVDPADVVALHTEPGKITFDRRPLTFDLPPNYEVSVTVPEDET